MRHEHHRIITTIIEQRIADKRTGSRPLKFFFQCSKSLKYQKIFQCQVRDITFYTHAHRYVFQCRYEFWAPNVLLLKGVNFCIFIRVPSPHMFPFSRVVTCNRSRDTYIRGMARTYIHTFIVWSINFAFCKNVLPTDEPFMPIRLNLKRSPIFRRDKGSGFRPFAATLSEFLFRCILITSVRLPTKIKRKITQMKCNYFASSINFENTIRTRVIVLTPSVLTFSVRTSIKVVVFFARLSTTKCRKHRIRSGFHVFDTVSIFV